MELGEMCYIPTAFSSMICSALVFAADMFAGLTEGERKNRRRNEMVGNVFGVVLGRRVLWFLM